MLNINVQKLEKPKYECLIMDAEEAKKNGLDFFNLSANEGNDYLLLKEGISGFSGVDICSIPTNTSSYFAYSIINPLTFVSS